MSDSDPYSMPQELVQQHLATKTDGVRLRTVKHSDEESLMKPRSIDANIDYTYASESAMKYPSTMSSFNLWVFKRDKDGQYSYGKVLFGNFISSLIAGFLFLLIASWSAIQHAQFNSGTITVALSQGIGVWFILLATAAVSADFNPTVTLYEMFLPHWRKRFVDVPGPLKVRKEAAMRSWGRASGLAAVVVVGSFIGSLLGALLGGALDLGNMHFRGTPVVNIGAGVGWQGALLVETVGSMLWLWAYLVAFQDRYRTHIPNPEAFLGFMWTMLVLLGYNYTGASYNWWRHLASAIVSGLFGEPEAIYSWTYYAGPAIGGLVVLIWFFVQRNSKLPE